MKIVKFKDGRYGVRKSCIFIDFYLDLVSYDTNWWTTRSKWMKDCKGTLEECRKALDNITDKGIPIENSL